MVYCILRFFLLSIRFPCSPLRLEIFCFIKYSADSWFDWSLSLTPSPHQQRGMIAPQYLRHSYTPVTQNRDTSFLWCWTRWLNIWAGATHQKLFFLWVWRAKNEMVECVSFSEGCVCMYFTHYVLEGDSHSNLTCQCGKYDRFVLVRSPAQKTFSIKGHNWNPCWFCMAFSLSFAN